MTGDAKRRFCEHCDLHVHNLSAMKPGERAEFIDGMQGRTCITYELRADGTMITPSRWDWMLRPMRAVAALLAALFPFVFSSCATRRTAGVPPPLPNPPAHAMDKKMGRVAVMGEACPIKEHSR